MKRPLAPQSTDGLVAVRAHGDAGIHLAAPSQGRTLCGERVRLRPPHRSLREAGCSECIAAALRAGHISAREGDRSWVNLARMSHAGA